VLSMNLYYDNIVYDLQTVGGISSYWYELTDRFWNHNVLRRKLNLKRTQISVSEKSGKLIERYRRLNDWPLQEPGVFHSSYFRVPVKNNKIKMVCTIHDFTHDLFFKGPRLWLHNFAKKRTIEESDAIITVSESTKKDLLKFYPKINESKVHVIYNGASEEFKQLEVKNQNQLHLLYVGARAAYKNFKFAVKLVQTQKDYHFDIVGSPLTVTEKAYLESTLKGRYTVHANISIEGLNLLYNQATCLLYPSSYEGFGIPLLESMRAGCPFIALNRSSIPEVAGDAGYLLDNLNLNEAREALAAITASRDLFSAKGHQQSLKFSWDKCYKETQQLYNSIV
jgi:mannosyltransferase